MKFYSVLFIIVILFKSQLFAYTKTDSLLHIIEKSTDTVKADAITKLAQYYFDNQKFHQSIKYIKEVIPLYKNDKIKQASLTSFIGSSYYFLGDYSSALEYYYKGLKIREKIGDDKLIATSYNNISNVYSAINKLDKAFTFLHKALKIEEKYNNKTNQVMLLNNIGEILTKQNKHEEALSYYLKCKDIIDSTDLKKSILYINIGKEYLTKKEYKKAKSYFFSAIDFSKTENDKYYLAQSFLNLANLFYSEDSYKQSLFFYNSSLTLSSEIGANSLIQTNYKGLSILFSKTLEIDSVVKYNKLYLSITDSIFSKYSANKIAELQTKYDFERKEEEITKLKTTNKLSLYRQKIIVIIFILIITMFLITILVFYFKNKRLKSDKFIVKQNIKLVNYENKLDNSLAVNNQTEDTKYQSSSLSEETITMLELSISRIMRKDKLYLNNDISINDLATLLNSTRNNISRIINERFEQNFNSFINEFRIKESMRLLSDTKNNIYTIDTISKKVGFNSISAFNSAFKKVAGVTPSFFIKSIE